MELNALPLAVNGSRNRIAQSGSSHATHDETVILGDNLEC